MRNVVQHPPKVLMRASVLLQMFVLFPNTLPETNFGESKPQPAIKRRIFDQFGAPPWVPNDFFGRHFRPKFRQRGTPKVCSAPPRADLDTIWRRTY